MGDAQSAQRDGAEEAAAEEQSAPEGGPSAENAPEKLAQNNGNISEVKPDGTIADKDKIAQEAVIVKGTNVELIQEGLSDPNEEEIIHVDAKQNDLNESFRRFFSNIGLKLTVKKGSGDQADDEAEKEVTEKLGVVEETSETKYEDVEQTTDLNVVQDNDSTTCPTMTDGTSDDVAVEEKITETKEKTDQIDGREDNVTVDEQDSKQNHNATVESETTQEEEIVSPIKKFFTTGIFAGLKKKKTEEEADDKELNDMSKNVTDATVHQKDIVESSPSVEEQTDVKDNTPQAMAPPEVEDRAKSPSTDQDSESELTSSQEKVQLSPFKRLFSGTTFKKRRSKREKGRRSSDSKLSYSGEQNENLIVASSEKTEQQDLVVETPSPPPPSMTQPEEELSAWEAFKKLMTPKKTLKRASIGSEDVQAGAAVEEAKPSEGERISDHSTEEGRKRKDSSHSWEAVLCGSGRRRSRKTSDSEDEQKQDGGEVESLKETRDAMTSTPKRADSPSSSESSTWKSFKKLMTPKRKIKDDEESKDMAQSDSEVTQEETLFSIKKLLPGRKKRLGDKQDQLSSDEGDNKEMVSAEEDSETPAVIPLSEFDKSETEDMPKTDDEIEDSDLESEQEHVLEIPKTFVQEVQEHQVTPIIALGQDQDELTEFSKYQPLSDIPEEGNITETAATSLIEDVVKDDTIAEDMVELTSEAITAPEPVDITMADETDELMLSAASHLTESSKTSGNATPVPAEYDVKDTEVFLKEVVDTISIATKAEAVCSEKPATERVISLVTHETFERSANEEQIVTEMHVQSEAVTTETGLKVDQLEDTDIELPVTVLSESLSEFKDAISTQYVSEVSKVEFESAKADVDEVHSAQSKRAIKQESVDDSDYMIESLSEVPESVEIILQDQNGNEKDILPAEYQEEPEAVRTESTEVLLEEKLESNHLKARQSDIQEDATPVASVPEIPKSDLNSVMDLDKEEVGSHETLVGLAQIEDEVQLNNTCKDVASQLSDLSIVTTTAMHETILSADTSEQEEQKAIETATPLGVNNVTEVSQEGSAVVLMFVPEAQLNKPETEEIEAVQLQQGCHEEDTEISKELGNNQTTEKFQNATETNVEVEIEDEFEIVYKEDVADTQESAIESQNQQVVEEGTVQKEEATNKQETIQNISTEEAEKEIMGENDQDIIEHPTSQINIEANEKEEFITEVTTSKESREEPGEVVPEVAISRDVEDVTNKLSEEIFEEKLINQTEPSKDQESVEQKTEERPTEAAQQDDNDGMEDKHPPDAATDEIDYKTEVCETMDNQQEMVQEEGTNAANGLIVVSSTEESDSSTISQLDYSVYINGDKSDTKPSEAQILQVNHSHEVAEDLKALPAEHVSSIIEDSGIAQVLEDTVNIEESSELCVSKTAEPIHEVHLCEKQVSVEGQLEEEIPCPETEVAEVEHAPLLEESMASLQQATATMPDLTIQNSVPDSEKIAKETSIPCVDNAEVISEPKYEVQLSEIEQVGVQGEKEEEIIVPETTNVDIQHTMVTQQTTCSYKDVASQLPNVTIVTTTTMHEPVLTSVISEQEEQEAIETTTPLEVNNVTQVAQEGSAVVLMHVPTAESENNHQIQVQVVNADIQSAEPRVDKALEIGVQEDKEVVDSCHETVERLDSFSATSNIEQEVESEKDKVTIKEIVQHLKAIPPESEEEPDDKEQPTGLVESKLSEDQKIIESNITTKEQVFTEMHDNDKDIQKQPSTQPQGDAPGNTAVALAQNTGIISSVGNIEAPSSLSLEFKLNIQFGKSPAPSPQAHFTTEHMSSPPQSPSAGPPVDKNYPAKTTEMSDIGVQAVEEERTQKNEPQTSEFVMAEAAVQATEKKKTDLKETLKNEELVEVGIQLDSIEEPIKEMSDAEITQNKTVLMHVSTQSTEMSEQSTQSTEISEQTDVKQEENALAENQSISIDVGTQSMHQEESNEDVKTTAEGVSIMRTVETVQPEPETEEKRVVQSKLVVLQVSDDKIKQMEDEDENQDVWMDAEEDIDNQQQITALPLCEIEESFESQPDYFQESKTDFEESLENLKKIALKCDFDSEGEDFAVALEDPQIETAVATVEWD